MATDIIFNPNMIHDVSTYEVQVRRYLVPQSRFSPSELQEMEGMLRGIKDKLPPDKLLLRSPNRPFDLIDLKAINTIPDWAGAGCSSFAAWGSSTKGGQVITGRNLDYFELPHLRNSHLILVRLQQDPLVKRQVVIGWPALIGACTGMNEDGVFVAMHDAPGSRIKPQSPFVPRSMVLRHILEQCSSTNATARAADILRQSPASRGNNFILVSQANTQPAPAVVFEYGGDETSTSAFVMRTPNFSANNTPPTTIACTNHFRQRQPPMPCTRYESIAGALHKLTAERTAIQPTQAMDIMRSAAVSGTLHTVIALPDSGELFIGFADQNSNATTRPFSHYTLQKLFNR